MIKVISIKGVRDDSNPHLTPDGHWVEIVFENDFGRHTLELNGGKALPTEPKLRRELEFLLWDYGLLEQQDSRTPRQRVRIAQELMDTDRLNHRLARDYMSHLGAIEQ